MSLKNDIVKFYKNRKKKRVYIDEVAYIKPKPTQKPFSIRILIIAFLLQLSTSCIKGYCWDYEYRIGAASPTDLSTLLRQATSLEEGLVSLGFRKFAASENEEKRSVELKGDYKHMTDLNVTISCSKQFTSPGHPALHIYIKSPDYPTDSYLEEGDELEHKIERFLEAGAGEEAGGRPE